MTAAIPSNEEHEMTAEYTEREELLSYISDAFKDVNGFRPRGIFAGLSITGLRAKADQLSAEIGEICAKERKHEQAVREALHDETAYVVVDPWYEVYGHTVEDAVLIGDFSVLTVYRPEPVPTNNIFASALASK